LKLKDNRFVEMERNLPSFIKRIVESSIGYWRLLFMAD